MIGGTVDQTTGEVLSVFQAVLRGLLDYDTGIRLLETQLMISGLISPKLRKCFDLQDAASHGLIDEQVLCQLKELNQVKEIISTISSPTIPVLEALAQGMISESMAIRVLEILLSTGFLVTPATGEQLTLQKAFQQNLVSSALFSKVLERQNTCKDLIDPCTAEKVSLADIIQRSILQENTGLRLLPVRPQEGGRITLKCGRNISILRAAHEGLIDRETMFRLLGAQLLSGGLISCSSDQRMTVEEAVAEGVIDRDMANSILTYQVQTGGIIHSDPPKRLTVDEAVQCDLITSSSALLVLEAQRGYVGLIWPHSGEIFPTSSSLQQELITNELAYKILNGRQKIAALYIPETSQVIGLDVAKQLGIIDNNTASILKNIMLPDKMPDLGGLEACKNARRWLSFCKFQPSTVHDYRQEEDVFDGEEPVATQSSEQTKKLFLSYLMINSYMDANTGQRLLLYDGDLNEAVGMLLEGCSAEFEGTSIKECLDTLRLPGVFLNNAPSEEKNDRLASPNSFGTWHCREPKHKEIPEDRKHAIDEEFNEMGNNITSSEFCESENLENRIATDHIVKTSSSVCVSNSASYSAQPGLVAFGMLRQDSEGILKNSENQGQVGTSEHVSECSHSKNIQNFASDSITNPIMRSKTSMICDLNEKENEGNISRDLTIFDYSPRLSALLSHDKLRNDQESLNDIPTLESNGNKCEDSTSPLSDQTKLSGQRMGETFQEQFLGIAAINISLQGERSQQKPVNIGDSPPLVQSCDDKCISETYGEEEKLGAASSQKPEDKPSGSKMEEDTCAMTPQGSSSVCSPLLLEGTVGAGDYETSLLDDQPSVTETDTDSEDDFYDTPLSEDDDHDSLLLEGDDRDCLQPEDYATLQEETDGAAPSGDGFYDISRENGSSVIAQGALVDSLSVRGGPESPQGVLMATKNAGVDLGERIHSGSVGSHEGNGSLLETVSERESSNSLEGDESDSSTDYEIGGRKESFSALLKFDDAGCWRGGTEEHITGQDFTSETEQLDSMQSEESYGDYVYDSDDDDGDDEEGVEGDSEEPWRQDKPADTDSQLHATAVGEKENTQDSQSVNERILLDRMHNCSSLENQQGVNALQLESTSKRSLVMERSNLQEYTTEVVGKSPENPLNHELALKDILLPITKDAESEDIFGSVAILHNTDTCSTSEVDNDLMNLKIKLIEGPESTDSVKGGDPYSKNVTLPVCSSFDAIICSEPDLMGKPAEESRLSSIASVTAKEHQGNERGVIVKEGDQSSILTEDETPVHEVCSGRGEVRGEGLQEDNRYLGLLSNESTMGSLALGNDQCPFPQITDSEEHNQKGGLKKVSVTLRDEPENPQTVVCESPVQFENLEEIFDSSVSRVFGADLTSDILLSEGDTSTERDSFTDGPKKASDLFTYLKHCTKDVKAKDVSKPSEGIPSCVLTASPAVKGHVQFRVNDVKEKTTLTQEISPLNEMARQSGPCTKESASEGGTGMAQFTPESKESTLSILPLRSMEDQGESNNFVPPELCTNGIRNGNSRSPLSTACSLSEINSRVEIIEQQQQKEHTLSLGLQEKEVQFPELSQVFVEDVKDILKSILEEGPMNPQEVEESSVCADTKTLLQNLIKRVSISQLANKASGVPSDFEVGDCSGVSPVNNSPELKAESSNDPFCIANLKSELLLDILRQNQYKQKITGAIELIKELTQMEYELEKRGITSKVAPLQLENIFYKLLADTYSEKVEQVSDLNQKSPTTPEMVDEKSHILDDLKSKEENHCSLSSQNIKDIRLESSTVCTSALPSDEKLGELCSDTPDHLESISGSKGMTSGDSSVEQVS